MKNLKKLTYEQKKRLTEEGLDAKQFLLKTFGPNYFIVVNRETNEEIRFSQ